MWRELFDERQRKEIKLNQLYLAEYAHGTDGHNARIIMGKMANLLDGLTEDSAVRDHINRLLVQNKIDNDEK